MPAPTRPAAAVRWRVASASAALALAAASLLATAPGGATASDGLPAVPLDLAAAELSGLRSDGQRLTLDGATGALRHPAVADGAPYGLAVWPPVPIPPGASAASLVVESVGALELELRTAPDATTWSDWTPGSRISLRDARYVQARAMLAETAAGSPSLGAAEVQFAPGADAGGGGEGLQQAAQAAQAAPTPTATATAPATSNPTVRVWATREGLVGGRTANGHRIVERDRFVALPSRRALASNGGKEYQVRLSYNGRTATAPVWDVGPWNVKDNYWDAPADRELFKDLPRFVPQVLAAWRDNHNGGRDGFNRWVTYPNAIDIADGTFWDDLGMRQGDWVDVTFLWVNAPSPPLPASNPVVRRKPPPGGQAAAAAPAEPPPGQRWYFAEGSTQPPFHTWLLLQNPAREPASVTLSYMLADGSTRTQAVQLRPTSRQSIFVNQVLENAAFSTRVDSDRPIFAERAMYVRKDGHASPGVMAPAPRWCIADGNTRDGTDTWLLVQNPSSAPARANVSFFLEGGGIVRRPLEVRPTSRLSVYANEILPEASFAACVEADQPVVVERAGYVGDGSGGGNGGAAVSALARTWYFAEGSTTPGASTTLALGNPNAETAAVDVTYLPEDGEPKTRRVSVPPMGKLAVDPKEDLPNARFGISVASSQPLVAERTMRFGPGGLGTHSSPGAPTLAQTWYLAEGSTAQPFQEYVLVANPNDAPTAITAEFMREDGSVVTRAYQLRARGRISIDANAEVPDAAISVRVRGDRPIVVERSMYWNDMAGGSNAIGVPWPS